MNLVVLGDRIDLRDADDCGSLSVQLPANSRDLDLLLRASGLGFWDGGPEVEVNVEQLRRWAAAGALSPDWPKRWDAMVRYAADMGWISTDGQHVRAHLDIVADV